MARILGHSFVEGRRIRIAQTTSRGRKNSTRQRAGQREAAEQRLEATKEALARALAEVSVPSTKLHELRVMLRDVKTT